MELVSTYNINLQDLMISRPSTRVQESLSRYLPTTFKPSETHYARRIGEGVILSYRGNGPTGKRLTMMNLGENSLVIEESLPHPDSFNATSTSLLLGVFDESQETSSFDRLSELTGLSVLELKAAAS
tara:strand:- start:599 stop:979 length:381 start_codon:yes stop_codon:yes gene_type:complete